MEYEIETKTEGEEIIVFIKGAMVIYVVRELSEKLQNIFISAPSLILNLKGVNEMDSAGIQLLFYLKKEADRLSKKLEITEHSAVVLRIMDIYGLVAKFADFIVLSKNERKEYGFNYGTKKSSISIKEEK